MGAIATVYTIIGFNTRNRKFAIFYLSIAAMGIIGMLFSGTRGALVVPFAGLAFILPDMQKALEHLPSQ